MFLPNRYPYLRGTIWFGAAVIWLSWLPGPARTAELCPVIRPGNCAAEAKILAALEDDTRLEFIETPLGQVMQFLEDQHDIPIKLDARALDDIGVGADAPLTANLKGVSLHAGLQVLLGQLDLTYSIENEVLTITTREAAESHPELRVYDVAALLQDGEDAATLVGMLQAAMQPETTPVATLGGYGAGHPGMPGGGGPAAGMAPGGMAGPPMELVASLPRIIPHKRLLVVRHTSVGHREFSKLLETLAAAAKPPTTAAEPKKP